MISENGTTTNAILYHIAEDLIEFFNGFQCLHKAKKQILDRYNIENHGNYCWPADVIEKAWKETKIMKKKKKQEDWAHVIMVQMIKHLIWDECKQNPAQEDSGFVSESLCTMSRTDEAPSPTEVNSINNEPWNASLVNETRYTLVNDREQQKDVDNYELCAVDMRDKENVQRKTFLWSNVAMKAQSKKEHPEDRSSQSTAEQSTMGDTGGDEQRSGGNPQMHSSGQTGGINQGGTGTPNTVQNQRTGNNPGGFNRQDGPAGALIQTQNNNCRETIYIYIPRLVMIHNEQIISEQPRDIISNYKFIDGLPGTGTDSVIMKRKSYVMSFNRDTMNANWVYEILNRNILAKNPMAGSFGNPYHKGHLAAAANHRWCQEAKVDANLIDNIVPQHMTLNTGPWFSLEVNCRKTVKDPNNISNVHVYSGPLYLRYMVPPVIQRKWVPSHFFKVIIEENEDGTVNQPQCYLFPNGNLNENEIIRTDVEHKMINHGTENERAITIEDIQQYSGLRFITVRRDVGLVDREIRVTLHGEDENAVPRTAEIQVTTSLQV